MSLTKALSHPVATRRRLSETGHEGESGREGESGYDGNLRHEAALAPAESRRAPARAAHSDEGATTMTTPAAFDLSSTFVHLGLGSVARELPGFAWTAEYLEGYEQETAGDGPDGRLVVMSPQAETWTYWECHPAGDELVVQLDGRSILIQDLPDGHNRIELGPGQAVINPKGVWHTADVVVPGTALFVTPGRGTEHRPR
jgi:mannose-6-phosphate isomerase-like protein (cupin superfamily)